MLEKAIEHEFVDKMVDYWENLFKKGDPYELNVYKRRVKRICKNNKGAN